VPTVRRYIDAYREKSGLDLSVVVTGTERRLEPHVEVLIFRTIQSLLANVREHAQATQAKVLLSLDDNQVSATVEDNGKGFDAEAVVEAEGGGKGLRTLRDRIEQVGGAIEFESKAGAGARVTFKLPVE